jgi:putative transposase
MPKKLHFTYLIRFSILPWLCAYTHNQGKIERYHRSMKNLILLDNYYSPSELEARIAEWVDYYNNHRYHEAINNVTPSDRYLGLDRKILKQRKRTKAETMRLRRKLYQSLSLKSLIESLN